jgi:hypothetical protein
MGDANLDRVVNSADAILLARNYQIPGRTNWNQGNFNYDTTINSADSAILQKHFNTTATGSAVPATSSPTSSPSASHATTPISPTTTTSSTDTSEILDTKIKKKRTKSK